MDTLLGIIEHLSQICRTHLSEIALGLLVTVFAVAGPHLNSWMQRQIEPFSMVIRLMLFILFCALIYGAGVIIASPWLAKGLAHLTNYTLAPVLIISLIAIGFMAERQYSEHFEE